MGHITFRSEVHRILTGIGTCLLVGFWIGAVPSLPIMLLSTIFDDRPAFWVWPMFGTPIALILSFSELWPNREEWYAKRD